jgi:hypothetical protein
MRFEKALQGVVEMKSSISLIWWISKKVRTLETRYSCTLMLDRVLKQSLRYRETNRGSSGVFVVVVEIFDILSLNVVYVRSL